MKKERRRKGPFKQAATALALAVLLQSAAGLVDPLAQESMEAYFREKSADNYVRIIGEKVEALRDINSLILENPSFGDSDTLKLIGYFISALQPVYITAIIITGIYLLFFSGSPSGRTKAKNSLVIMMLCLAAITVSPQILTMMFGFSKAITLGVLSLAPVNTEEPFVHAADYLLEKGVHITSHKGLSGYMWGVDRAGVPFLLLPYAVLEGMLLALKLRFYIVAILAMALPLTITLYALMPTRGIGKLLIENTILWTFAQAATAGTLVVVALGMDATNLITSFAVPEGLRFLMELAGVFMLMLTPFVVVRLFNRFLS